MHSKSRRVVVSFTLCVMLLVSGGTAGLSAQSAGKRADSDRAAAEEATPVQSGAGDSTRQRPPSQARDDQDVDDPDDPARGGPSCQLNLEPSVANWGGRVTLKSEKPGRFGSGRGEIRLHDSRNPNSSAGVVSVSSWKQDSISGRLPSAPPNPQATEYFISVTRANKSKACGFLSLSSKDNTIAPSPAPCVFVVTPSVTRWGETIVLTAPVSFGSSGGEVHLEDLLLQNSYSLDGVAWNPPDSDSSQQIAVTLPSETAKPDWATGIEFAISVTRSGESAPCHRFSPLTIEDVDLPVVPCAFLPDPSTTEWGATVVLTAPLGFGASDGLVQLHDELRQNAVTLPGVVWSEPDAAGIQTATVPLPQEDSKPGWAAGIAYLISVTRAGETAPCHASPLTVASPIDCSLVPGWVEEAFDLNLPSPILDVDQVEGTQEATLESIRTNVTNPLTELVDLDEIQFLFRLTDSAGQDQALNVVASSSDGSVPSIGPEAEPTTQTIAKFRIKPDLAPETGGVGSRAYKAHMDASLTVPGCGLITVPDVGGVLDLVQNSLRLPTMALLYEHPDLAGSVMVFLPATTTAALASSIGHWDDRNRDELAVVRTPVAIHLEVTKNILSSVQEKLGSLADGLPIPTQILSFLEARVLDIQRAAVVNATGRMADLNEAVIKKDDPFWPFNSTFNDRISSLVLIGFNPATDGDAPVPLTGWFGWEEPDFKASQSRWGVAFGDMVAAIPHLGESGSVPGIPRPRWILPVTVKYCGGGWGGNCVEDTESSMKLESVNSNWST